MKFRKKPVVVEAIRYIGHNIDEIEKFVGKTLGKAKNVDGSESINLLIPTLEGEMTAIRGDWIIKGIKGEFYPCKSDIFEQPTMKLRKRCRLNSRQKQ